MLPVGELTTKSQIRLAEHVARTLLLGTPAPDNGVTTRRLSEHETRELQDRLRGGACAADAMLDSHNRLVQPSAAMRDLAARTKAHVQRNADYCMLFKFLFNFLPPVPRFPLRAPLTNFS